MIVDDLFEVIYGTNLELNKLKKSKHGINFVSRTSKNNGVSARVELLKDVKPIEAGVITVAGGGAVMEAFVQEKPFYSGRDLFYLKPRKEMTISEKLFYSMCLRKNKFKYSYGRQANRTLKFLIIPDKIPDWVYKIKTKDYSEIKKSFSENKISLKSKKWRFFEIESDLFEVTGSKTTSKIALKKSGKGNFPYVTTQATNNGIEGFYNVYTENGNVLTIDSAVIGFCSYQLLNFSASDHVEKLIPKFNLNVYTALFITTIINLEQFRYNYGRKFNQERIKKTKILLPVDENNKPDWEFMEDYIKSLKYSKTLA